MKKNFMDKFPDIYKNNEQYLPDYVFDEELANETFIEIKKKPKKKKNCC